MCAFYFTVLDISMLQVIDNILVISRWPSHFYGNVYALLTDVLTFSALFAKSVTTGIIPKNGIRR